jgi:hypothetical protein
MINTNAQQQNELLFAQVLKATNDELITMYVRCTNKFAAREIKQRGIY